MFVRLMVTLTGEEPSALTRMAADDCRDPREQLRYLLREEARRRGLLAEGQQEEEHAELTRPAA